MNELDLEAEMIAVELAKRPASLKGLKPDERVKLDTMHYKRADAYVVGDDVFIYWQASFKTFKSRWFCLENFRTYTALQVLHDLNSFDNPTFSDMIFKIWKEQGLQTDYVENIFKEM